MNAKGICLKIVSVILSAVMLFPYCTVEAGNSMKAGQDCIELIKKCEGFSKYKYWDYSQWTIGYNGFYKSFEITVSEPDMYELPGDLNGDGVRDIFDLVLLNRFVFEGRGEFPSERVYLADINGDGYYDIKDIEALSRIVSEQ